MKRTFCDLCNRSVNYGVTVGRKVKVKVYDSGLKLAKWHTLDICEYCEKVIVERSKQLAKEKNDEV